MNSLLKPVSPSPRLDRDREELTAIVERYATVPGNHETAWPGLNFFRAEAPSEEQCALYEPCLGLPLQGAKQITIGDERYVQQSGYFLINSIDVPALAQVIEASPDEPCLCITLRLDPLRIGEWLSELQLPKPASGTSRGIALSVVSEQIVEPLLRLARLLDQPQDLPRLAPLIERELVYRLLTSDQGWRLAQLLHSAGQGQQVARAIHWLKVHYAKPLRIAELAALVNMSASSLHHHFREVTAMSPLQYQKLLRLHEARRLLVTEGCDVASVAHRVGYESPSQFSREYSRQHGAPPLRDVSRLKAVRA